MMYTPTARTTSLRNPDKLSYDTASVDDILEASLTCQLAYVLHGEPRILPTAFGRIDDTLYIHGSTGSRVMLEATDGLDVCASFMLQDGIVFSRSWFHHSANYRSLVVHGRATPVNESGEKLRGLKSIIDQLEPGRSQHSRPPTLKELAGTGVLRLPMEEISVRTRNGGPNDDPDDLDLPYWAGEVPLTVTAGEPIADNGVPHHAAVPRLR